MHRAGMLCRLASPSRAATIAVRSSSSNVGKPPNPIAAPTTQVRQQSLASAVSSEPFMNATSSMYIEQMYSAWKADPKSVHASWDAYFRNVEGGAAPGQAYQAPPTAYGAVGVPGVLPLIPGVPVGGGFTMPQMMPSPSKVPATGLDSSVQAISDHLKVQLL
ncbi:hypothetical protein COOONC_17822, partial [Cooperia oncophora]